MGTTKGNVKRTLRLGPDPTPEAMEALNWKGGRKSKDYGISKEQLDWLLSTKQVRL